VDLNAGIWEQEQAWGGMPEGRNEVLTTQQNKNKGRRALMSCLHGENRRDKLGGSRAGDRNRWLGVKRGKKVRNCLGGGKLCASVNRLGAGGGNEHEKDETTVKDQLRVVGT